MFTKLQHITRLLYPEEDEYYLDYLEEDGQLVEPRYFIPVIPTLLLVIHFINYIEYYKNKCK